LEDPMAVIRLAGDCLGRWVRESRDGFWNCLDWLGF
jgi:hypothetical protein